MSDDKLAKATTRAAIASAKAVIAQTSADIAKVSAMPALNPLAVAQRHLDVCTMRVTQAQAKLDLLKVRAGVGAESEGDVEPPAQV